MYWLNVFGSLLLALCDRSPWFYYQRVTKRENTLKISPLTNHGNSYPE